MIIMFLKRGDPNAGRRGLRSRRKREEDYLWQTNYKPKNQYEEYPFRLLLWATYIGTYQFCLKIFSLIAHLNR